MANGDLALPAGHVPSNAGAPPTLRVAVGRLFRQPLDLTDAALFSPGLELWLHSDASDRRLYAMFDCLLRFVGGGGPGSADQVRSLVTLGTQQAYRDMRGALEPPPNAVVYDNVDRASVQDALHQLILTAYNSGSAHPVLITRWQGKRLKLLLDEAGGNADAQINAFIGEFFNGTGLVRLNAGDYLGDAALPLATDLVPPGLPFAGSARRVTITTEEYVGNQLNPSYFLWRFLKDVNETPAGQRRVNLITRAPRRADGTLDHPLLDAMALDLDSPVLPRVLSLVQLPNIASLSQALLFPVGRLSDWHGEEWAGSNSTIQWRITSTPNLEFQTQNAPGAPQPQQDCPIDVTNVPQQRRNLMEAVWRDWGTHLNRICTELQVPMELIAATIGQESLNNPRALALEALRPNEVNALQAAVPQAVVNAYVALTPRYGLSVPNPWNGAATISAAQSPLTWDQLLDVIDVVPGRMSPGLIQTLVVNGEALYAWLAQWYTNVPQTFGVADPFAAGQPRYRDWFLWLLTGEHALLAGVAYHKRSYSRQLGALDLPRMGSLFNSGNKEVTMPLINVVFPLLNDSRFLNDSGRASPPCPALPAGQADPRNPWRLLFNDLAYPRSIGLNYNAIQSHFRNGANTANGGQVPIARFWKNA